jgi:pimeloyl-ACP methyl ester carboxylesterase
LGNIPLIVLIHGHLDPIPPSVDLSPEVLQQEEEGWRQMQSELAMLSPKGKLVVAEKSGHFIILEQPELVIEAIQQVVADARK